MKTEIKISGMSCMHCVNAVTDALKSIDGVKNAAVDLKKKSALIESEKDIQNELIKTKIDEAGYEVIEITKI